MSDKPQKEFLHVDVNPGHIGQNLLASYHNEGWELYTHAQWDSVSRVWRVLLYRDVKAPAPTPTLIAETTPTVDTETVEVPAPTPEPITEETPIEAESTDKLTKTSPVIINALIPASSLTFVDEMHRIRADKSLSPMEKVEEIIRVGDEIALAKARIAGKKAWDVWNSMYPITKSSFLLSAKVGS